MKNLFIFFMLFSSITAFSQTREQLLEEYMKERNKMMQEIMKMFQDDMMGDDFFDSNDVDDFFKGKSYAGGSANVSVEQKYETDGSISIIITPKNKDVQLDISTENNLITIKSEMKVEEQTDSDQNSFKSISMSSFSRSVAIPSGYTAQSPVQAGKGIKISLIPQDKLKKLLPKSKPKQDKVPIGKQPGEQTI